SAAGPAACAPAPRRSAPPPGRGRRGPRAGRCSARCRGRVRRAGDGPAGRRPTGARTPSRCPCARASRWWEAYREHNSLLLLTISHEPRCVRAHAGARAGRPDRSSAIGCRGRPRLQDGGDITRDPRRHGVLAALNEIVDAVEADPADEVDIAAIAVRHATTEYHLRRMFSSLAGLPVSEYVRRRRMSRAAAEVARSEADLLTIAVRYGYGSSEAFARAFRAVHGLGPSD